MLLNYCWSCGDCFIFYDDLYVFLISVVVDDDIIWWFLLLFGDDFSCCLVGLRYVCGFCWWCAILFSLFPVFVVIDELVLLLFVFYTMLIALNGLFVLVYWAIL